MRKFFTIAGYTTILLYGTVFFLYYFDVINAFLLIGFLLVELVLLLLVLIIYRNSNIRIIKISTVLLIGILLFEFRLLSYEPHTYRVSMPYEPIEAVENSGIHLMVVKTIDFEYLEDPQKIVKSFEYESQEFLNLHKINNEDRYKSKNSELINWVMNKEEEFTIMKENVKRYLSGDTSSIDSFLKRDDIEGNSAGLGVALSSLVADGSLQNNRDFGVTGALSPTGKVLPIGMVEEKIRIAEKYSYLYMIVPSGNVEEALQVKNDMKLKIEVFEVSHIDQAISLINKMNEEG